MKFELGKYYKHNTGEELHIVGIVETTLYGLGYAAETTTTPHELKVVGMREDHATNYFEITKEQWMKNFS